MARSGAIIDPRDHDRDGHSCFPRRLPQLCLHLRMSAYDDYFEVNDLDDYDYEYYGERVPHENLAYGAPVPEEAGFGAWFGEQEAAPPGEH